jgi:hypothetical protein
MSILRSLYWALVVTLAAIAGLAAGLPFTGLPASLAGFAATGLVCLTGITLAPTKGNRP